MTSWQEFAQRAPELAAFGKTRFQSEVAYLATLRPDGSPRVHPVTPIIGEQLFLFMEPTSPKGKDLQRDGRYMLHCSVGNSSGGGSEFHVSQQDLKAGLVDEMESHVANVPLGAGRPLFANIGDMQIKLERTRVMAASAVSSSRIDKK